MSTRLNYRLIFIALLLAGLAFEQIAREERPSILGPGLHLRAYVANSADGTISVVDLVGLSSIATVPVGRAPSGLKPLPAQKEIWGVAVSALRAGDRYYREIAVSRETFRRRLAWDACRETE